MEQTAAEWFADLSDEDRAIFLEQCPDWNDLDPAAQEEAMTAFLAQQQEPEENDPHEEVAHLEQDAEEGDFDADDLAELEGLEGNPVILHELDQEELDELQNLLEEEEQAEEEHQPGPEAGG